MKTQQADRHLKRPAAVAGFSAIVFLLLFMQIPLFLSYAIIILLASAAAVSCILKKHYVCRFLTLLLAVSAAAFLFFQANENLRVNPSMMLLNHTADIEGVVYSAPDKRDRSTLLTLDRCTVNGKKTKLRIKVYVTNGDPAKIGDVYRIEKAEFFAAPDEDEYYYHTLSNKIWLYAYSLEGENTGNTSRNAIYRLNDFRNRIYEYLISSLGEERGAIASALLIGEKRGLTSSFKTALRISGASHLFAVSGMHLSICTAVFFYILRKRTPVIAMPNICAAIFTVTYMLLTGLSPSVTRAGLMLLTVISANLLHKKSDPVNALGISVIAQLLFNVYLAGNVSFLLSCASTLGLLTVFPYLQSPVGRKTKIAKRFGLSVKNALLLSFSAILATIPISGIFFGSVSLLGAATTLLCTLPVQGILLISFSGLFFSFIQPIASAVFAASGWLCSLAAKIIFHFSSYNYLMLPVPPRMTLAVYALIGVILLAVYFFFGRNGKRVILTLMCCVIVILVGVNVKCLSMENTARLYIPQNGNTTNLYFSIGLQTYRAVIGAGEDGADTVVMSDVLKRNAVYWLDALIVPRNSSAEDGNTYYYAGFSDAVYTVAGNQYATGGAADCFDLTLPKGFTYRNRNTNDYAAGILQGNNTKIVFSFYPAGDFRFADDAFLCGDYLICRGGIPMGLDASDFGEIIVLSDKSSADLHLPPNVRTTAEAGEIIIEMSAS